MKKALSLFVFSLLLPALAHAAADTSCLSIPANDDQLSNTGSFNKKEFREEMIGQQQNPATDLMGCATSVTQAGNPAGAIKGNCGCKKAIESLCSFKNSTKKITASGGADAAWCAPFAPWAL